MKRPTLGELAELGQVVGAAGVIISLIYVGAQLRQNTNALRAGTFQQMTSTSIQLLSPTVTDTAFADFYLHAAVHPDALTTVERARWHAIMLSSMRHYEDLHYQWQMGLLDPQVWAGYDRLFRANFELPGWLYWWEHNKPFFSERFQEHIAEALRAPPAVQFLPNGVRDTVRRDSAR